MLSYLGRPCEVREAGFLKRPLSGRAGKTQMPHIVPQLHRASRHYENTSFAPEKEWTINFSFGSENNMD